MIESPSCTAWNLVQTDLLKAVAVAKNTTIVKAAANNWRLMEITRQFQGFKPRGCHSFSPALHTPVMILWNGKQCFMRGIKSELRQDYHSGNWVLCRSILILNAS